MNTAKRADGRHQYVGRVMKDHNVVHVFVTDAAGS